MAEALLAQRLRERGVDARVESAGTHALVGHGADTQAVELMRRRGIELSAHRARQLTPELIRAFDVLFVMEAGQQRFVEALEPSARGRVHRLGRIGKFDVPDPYRRGAAAFEQALSLIDRGIVELENVFWSRS